MKHNKENIDSIFVSCLAVIVLLLLCYDFTSRYVYRRTMDDVCETAGLRRFDSCDGKDICGYGYTKDPYFMCSGNETDYNLRAVPFDNTSFYRESLESSSKEKK